MDEDESHIILSLRKMTPDKKQLFMEVLTELELDQQDTFFVRMSNSDIVLE